MDKHEGLAGEQVTCSTPEEGAHALARRLIGHLQQRLRDVPVVHLALSGGTSGALLCDVLVGESGPAGLPWRRVHLWMVDERFVGPGDPRLNFAQPRDRLAPQVGLPAANLHPMPVTAVDGAESYARELDAALTEGSREGRLDAVVLGVGPDGHTASLFPRTPALGERQRRVVVNDGDTVTPPRPRMTMTYPTLNNARLIMVLATGASKRAPLSALASGPQDVQSLPIAGIVPAQGSRMVWYLDRASAPPRP
jgi:6-phosphogluconolactonase